MEIKTVSIIGLGALGILFGNHLSKRMPRQQLRIIADRERIARYQHQHIYCNGDRCDFCYVTPEQVCEPSDLVIFAVKFNNLDDAIAQVKNHVGPQTMMLSLLNGITSESIIGQVYRMEQVLGCVAQGMDAVRVGNRLTYDHMGMLCIGDLSVEAETQKVEAVAHFLKKMGIPYEIDCKIAKRIWSKFMFNVGVNQTVAIFESNYGIVQREGRERDMLIGAMREVIALSEKEGMNLSEDDLCYWLKILSCLNSEGKPSMRQDLEAKRYSEVGLFAGTVLKLGEKHGIQTPINQELYEKIISMERYF